VLPLVAAGCSVLVLPGGFPACVPDLQQAVCCTGSAATVPPRLLASHLSVAPLCCYSWQCIVTTSWQALAASPPPQYASSTFQHLAAPATSHTPPPAPQQNTKIGVAILNVRPYYSAAQLEAQYATEREMLARLSTFRANPLGASGQHSRASSARISTSSMPSSPHAGGAR
jgi:hypothetical protein